MAFEQLTEQEQSAVQQCMKAILNGDEIEDPEFQTRLGIDRLQLRQVLVSWPHLDDADDNSDTCLAINNCMNEVVHGISISPEDWARQFTLPKEDVRAAFKHWRSLKRLLIPSVKERQSKWQIHLKKRRPRNECPCRR